MSSRNTFILVLFGLVIVTAMFYFLRNYPNNKLDTPQTSSEMVETTEFVDVDNPTLTPPEKPQNALEYDNFKGEIKYSVKNRPVYGLDITVEGTTDKFAIEGWFNPDTNSFYIAANVDFKDFKSDEPKRDEHLLTLFKETQIAIQCLVEEDEIVVFDEEFEIEMPVLIKINGVTRGEVFGVTATVTKSDIIAYGKSKISMSDYGIIPPLKVGSFKADDSLEISFNIAGTAKSN